MKQIVRRAVFSLGSTLLMVYVVIWIASSWKRDKKGRQALQFGQIKLLVRYGLEIILRNLEIICVISNGNLYNRYLEIDLRKQTQSLICCDFFVFFRTCKI